MLHDFLVLGNCQSSAIAVELANNASVKRFFLSYPNFFPEKGLQAQREFLVDQLGPEMLQILMRHGLLLPIPSFDDIAAHDYKRIILTIGHPLRIYGAGNHFFFGSNIDLEQYEFVNFDCKRHTPGQTYVEAYASMLHTLRSAYPHAPITIVVRATAPGLKGVPCTCWFDDWMEHVKEFNAKIISTPPINNLDFLYLDDFLPRYPRLIPEPLGKVYLQGKIALDLEHLPMAIWRRVVRALESGVASPPRHADGFESQDAFEPISGFYDFTAERCAADFYSRHHQFEKSWLHFLKSIRIGSFLTGDLPEQMRCGLRVERRTTTVLQEMDKLLQDLPTQDRTSIYGRVYTELAEDGDFQLADELFPLIPEPDTDTLLRHGVRLRKANNHEEALFFFSRALSIARNPCEERSVRKEQCVTLYEMGWQSEAFAILSDVSADEVPAKFERSLSWKHMQSSDLSPCLVVGTAPAMLIAYLLQQLFERDIDVSLLCNHRLHANARQRLTAFAPLPNGRICVDKTPGMLPDDIRETQYQSIIIATSGLNIVGGYKNVYDFAASLRHGGIYFYSFQQMLNNYRTEELFQNKLITLDSSG